MKLTFGTVMFLDLRNFTLLTTRMVSNPREAEIMDSGLSQYETRLNYLVEQTRILYHEWHEAIRRKIENQQIDKYLFQVLGDGAMVALEGKQHARASLDLAMEIGGSMSKKIDDAINPRIEALGIRRRSDHLDFGIGMYTGEYSYVELPESSQSNENEISHTIIGTAANYASRVENANKDHDGARITIAETTIQELCRTEGIPTDNIRHIEDSLEIRYAWRHKLKGMPPIGLYFKPIE